MSQAMNEAQHSHVGADQGPTPADSDLAATDVSGTPHRFGQSLEDDASPQRAVILSEADIKRTLDRIAHQILESIGSNSDAPAILVGIPRRGVPLAQRLAGRMTTFAGGHYPVGALDITLFRDDLRGRPPRALAETSLPTGGVDGLTVVLVDDVLYSGRTIRAAMDALREHGRPAAVRLAVLVDRGHRQLPIRADYVGKNIPTAFDDDVAVHLTETDGFDAVTVERAL
jgi:pyrimidine operon attenuation protein/uracil phosphoribosyltransferase